MVLIYALICASIVQATTFVDKPLAETVQDVTMIVRGQVGMSYSDWAQAPDGTRRIYTYTQLQIGEVFKGQVQGTTLLMRELGGTKDGSTMEVVGAARFEKGEDVIVLLGTEHRDGSHEVYGLSQGKYSIAQDEQGVEYLRGAGLKEGPSPGKSRWRLSDLRQLIKRPHEIPKARSSPEVEPANPAIKELSQPLPKPPALEAPGLLASWQVVLLVLVLVGVILFLIRRR